MLLTLHVLFADAPPPAVIFWENVPGVLSTKDNAFGCFLAGLAGENDPLEPPGGKWTNAGCVSGPQRTVAWRVLDAQYFGVAQRRRRVFVVASARKGFDPAQVLFEWDGVRRDTAPSREARQTAPTIPARSTAGGGLGTASDGDGGLIPALSQCITTGTGQRYDPETETILPVTHTLRGEGFDASEDGTVRGTPLVPVGVTIHGTDPTVQKVASYSEVAQCLRARTPGNIDNSSTTVVQQPVAFDTTQITSAANRSNPQPGDACHPLAAGAHAPAIAFPANLSGTQCASAADVAPSMGAANPTGVAYTTKLHNTTSNQAGKVYEEYTTSLDRSSPPPALLTAMQVRRLTPEECEALQGFPDSYTMIPWRGKPANQCPDGPRYKALGNSWAVPNVRWIGERIQRHLAGGL